MFDDLTQTTKSMIIPIAFAIIGFILSNFGNYKKLFGSQIPTVLPQTGSCDGKFFRILCRWPGSLSYPDIHLRHPCAGE